MNTISIKMKSGDVIRFKTELNAEHFNAVLKMCKNDDYIHLNVINQYTNEETIPLDHPDREIVYIMKHDLSGIIYSKG